MWLGALPADVFPSVREEMWYVSERAAVNEDPTLVAYRSTDGAWYRLAYADGIEFRVSADGARVGCAWPAELSLEDAATYLLGSICGFVLRLRGVTSLHASAIAIGELAVAVTGPAGAGKSTTAAAFAARGNAILSDDVVALVDSKDGVRVRPAYPHLRLWPDAVQALYGGARDLPPLTPTWEKRFLDLEGEGGAFHAAPLPLGAVYVLAGREDADDAPRLEALGPSDALLTLLANVYMGWLPGAENRARDLALLGRVAARSPVVVATPHADPARLPELCDAIEADFLARRARSASIVDGRS